MKENEKALDYVLGLTVDQFMLRRLQTIVSQRDQLAKSIHHARIMIRQRHIAVGKQMVDIPSFMVKLASEQHIQYAPSSCFKTNLPGRMKAKKAKLGGNKDE
jgi:small subunit ribosomal protein S9e|tara:strand:+ start:420 stop:725 length:306 start_codon:yes stop_codon:yes gene_type:complete